MASTTKMMTAYLALERLPMNRLIASVDYQAIPGESLMGLEAGQRVSVRDLLYGLILLSGNDAAVTLARAVSGTVPRFVRLMNRTARRLGLTDTSYENPVGLDDPKQYSSARDLASLGRDLMEDPQFRRIASSRSATLHSYRPPIEIETANDFVADNGWAKGIKTGHTERAGYVLASDGRRKAAELIGAVMGAPTEAARDAETVELMDYGFSLYDKRVPVPDSRPAARVPVRFEDGELALFSPRAIRIGVRDGQRLGVVRNLPGEVEGPLEKGARIGTATVWLDGEKISSVPLLAARSVAAPSTLDRIRDVLTGSPVYVVLALLIVISVTLLARRRRERTMRSRMRTIGRGRR
jgi:D-alanyl-D-alanine carboxypeptidase (penicillin-binding protein 5/6)